MRFALDFSSHAPLPIGGLEHRMTNPTNVTSRSATVRAAGAILAALAVAALLALPGAALAATPSGDQYDDSAQNVQSQVSGGGSGPSDSGSPSSGLHSEVGPLPFTGLDLIAMAVVAVGVVGLGIALQRMVAVRRR
jgi:hypothetical protein